MVRLNIKDTPASDPGSRYEPEYQVIQDKETGMISLKEIGKRDIYSKIQSFRDMCDINVIVDRFQHGDLTVLNQIQSNFMDTTAVPTNYAEVLQTVKDGQKVFDRLPTDIKQKFDNNFETWFAEYGKESWISKMGIELKKDTEIPLEPIKTGDVDVKEVKE